MVVGFLMTWRKLPWKKRFSLWQILVIKKEIQECPLKSEAHQNTSGPSSEVTKTKLKERLEGKDVAVIISEDDDNNSFLHKSEGQDETTENTRKFTESSYKDERHWKDLTALFMHNDKNSNWYYVVSTCKIIIRLNKATSIDVKNRSVGSTGSKGWIL